MISIEELSAIVKSLIISNQNATTIEGLEREFRENEGYSMPLYGYIDTQDLLINGLNKAVSVLGRGPKAIVKAIINSKTQHMHDLVTEQKTARTRRRLAKPARKRNQTYRNTSRYSSNISSDNSWNNQTYTAAWSAAAVCPQFSGTQSLYNGVNFGCRIFGNALASLHMSTTSQRFQPAYNKENWQRKDNYFKSKCFNTSRDTTGSKKSSNFVKKPLQSFNAKCSKDWNHNTISNDFGHESSFKAKVSSFSHSNASLQSAASNENDNNNNKAETVSLSAAVQQDLNCDDVVPFCACDNREDLLEQVRLYQNEILNRSSKSKEDLEEAAGSIEFVENLNETSEDSYLTIHSLDADKTLSSTEKLNKSLTSTEDLKHNKGLVNVTLTHNVTHGSNDSALIDLNNSLPALIFSVKGVSSISAQDLNEAVPDFAVNNRVFSFDFPEGTVPYGRKIEPFQMPVEVQVDSIISIYISEIHNPFRFWFHYAVEGLDELMHNIELFYAQEAVLDCYKLLREQITCGQICVALYGGAWHRAEILSNTIIADKVKVLYLDYGTVGDVALDDLMYLNDEFAHDHAYACRGSLAEINPIRLHWSTASTLALLTMTKNRKLHAKICEIDVKNNVFYLQIVDNHTEQVVNINRELIKMKHATKCYEWIKSKLTFTKRLRHKREDYPTFDMLEDGNYPTFVEIYEMEVNGIHYEDITDKMIFHPNVIEIENLNDSSFLLLPNNPFKDDIEKLLLEQQMTETVK